MKPTILLKNMAAIFIVIVCIGFMHYHRKTAPALASTQVCNNVEQEAPASANDFIFLQSFSRNILSVNLP